MGGGDSGNFVGTAGSVRDYQPQISLDDYIPVSNTSTDIIVGIGAGNFSDSDQFLSVEMVLYMCKRCKTGEITPIRLIEWLEYNIAANIRMAKILRSLIKKYIPIFNSSLDEKLFFEYLLEFIKALHCIF